MEMQFEHITPEIAANYLKTSKGNPRWKNKVVNKRAVQDIARDILNGDWKPGNGSLAFDDNGHLIDGHHRLSAVVMSQTPIDVWVCRGVNLDGQLHIDDNAKRTVAQRLGTQKYVPAIANMHFKLTTNTRGVATAKETAVFQELYGEHIDTVVKYSSSSGVKLTATAYFLHAALCALACGVPDTVLAKFAASLNNGFIEGPDESAVIAVRNQLCNNRPATDIQRIQADKNIQAAIADYVAGVPRKNYYKAQTACYTEKLA